MKRTLTQFAPYLVLGAAGVAGLLVATTQLEPEVPAEVVIAEPEPELPISTAPFVVEVDFDRRLVPRDGRAFVRVAVTGIKDRAHARRPVELTLAIDRSGSMWGAKLAHAKRAAKEALATLNPGDTMRVIAFGSEAREIASGPVSSQNLAEAAGAIDRLGARGDTNMLGALKLVARKPFAGVRRLFLVSDGHPDRSSGLSHHVEVLAERGVVTTTLGVGLDYNEDLMANLADSGRGNYYFVEHAHQLAEIFTREVRELDKVVATNAVLDVESLAGLQLKALGVPSTVSRTGPRVPLGDIYAGRTVEVLFDVPLSAFTSSPEVFAHVGADAEHASARASALFSRDPTVIANSAVPAVQIQVAKWRSSQVWLAANASFNALDLSRGNAFLDDEIVRLQGLSARYRSRALDLELSKLVDFRVLNNDGVTSRRLLNNRAKWQSRALNRSQY